MRKGLKLSDGEQDVLSRAEEKAGDRFNTKDLKKFLKGERAVRGYINDSQKDIALLLQSPRQGEFTKMTDEEVYLILLEEIMRFWETLGMDEFVKEHDPSRMSDDALGCGRNVLTRDFLVAAKRVRNDPEMLGVLRQFERGTRKTVETLAGLVYPDMTPARAIPKVVGYVGFLWKHKFIGIEAHTRKCEPRIKEQDEAIGELIRIYEDWEETYAQFPPQARLRALDLGLRAVQERIEVLFPDGKRRAVTLNQLEEHFDKQMLEALMKPGASKHVKFRLLRQVEAR